MIYGQMQWWVGVVEDRNDPMKVGRYKVRILGYHTEDKAVLPTADLPWAVTMQPVGSAAISGIGNSGTGLVNGTQVVGFFTDGENEQLPIIMGSLGGVDTVKANTQKGFSDPDGVYPLNEKGVGRNTLDESSLSRLARGGDDAEQHKSLGARRANRITEIPFAQPSQFEGVFDTAPTVKNKSETDDGVPRWDEPHPQGVEKSVSEYPYNKVRETESGNIEEFDDTPGAERIHTYHLSGSFDEIHPDGSHVQKIVGDDFELVYKDKTLYVDGNLNISVKGDVNMKVDGNKIEDINGDVYTTIRGGRFTKVSGNDILDVISDQKTTVEGSRYTLINCASADPSITLPIVGSVPAGQDSLVVKGSSINQIGGRKNEQIGNTYVMSAMAGIKYFSNLGSMEVMTLKNVNIATGITGQINLSTGTTNIASAVNTDITSVGALAITSAAATYSHAATSMTASGFSLTSSTFTTTGTITATGDVTGAGKSLSTHTHNITSGSSAGVTSTPN